MGHDAFSKCHPAVNFLFFLGAIGFGVVLQHPAYIAASVACGLCYYLLLTGRKGLGLIFAVLPLWLIMAAVNPLFNTRGETVLFTLLGKPYTLEALIYGAATGSIFLVMTLWFGCYSAVLTADKFTFLFGSAIPSLSLLLVMILRMIPSLLRKAVSITTARQSIGLGAGDDASFSQKLRGGMAALSALTDWSLEGSVVTADSMRARGYGCAKRTSFRQYPMTAQDGVLLGVMAALLAGTLLTGRMEADYLPAVSLPSPGWGLLFYTAYLLLPAALHWKEAIQWRICISKI